MFFHDLSASSLIPCNLKQPNSKISCRLALRICSIILEHSFPMRALQFFGVCFYFFFAILTSQSWAALTIDQSCLNVPVVGDMTDTINNQMFFLALNAQETLEEFIYRPQDMTVANRQRINELLAALALPSSHPRFRRAVDGLIGRSPKIFPGRGQVPSEPTLTGLDAFRRIGRVSSRSRRRNFFTRTIYCDTDAANFPRYTTNSDGSPIMLNGQPSFQYYCKQTTKTPIFRPCLSLLECDHGLLTSIPIGRQSLRSTRVATYRSTRVRRGRTWNH